MVLLYLCAVLAAIAGVFYIIPVVKRFGPFASICLWLTVLVGVAFGYQWLEKEYSLGYSASGSKDVRFKKAFDGHFYILGRSQGGVVRFLFDTGASDIVLSPKDAQTLGFELKALNYVKSYHTSNGVIRAAPVVIPALKIGGVAIKDIPASVSSVPSPYSLMGMSFIENFAFTINDDTLILTFE